MSSPSAGVNGAGPIDEELGLAGVIGEDLGTGVLGADFATESVFSSPSLSSLPNNLPCINLGRFFNRPVTACRQILQVIHGPKFDCAMNLNA